MRYWPGTRIPKSTGNAFDVKPGEASIFTLTFAHLQPARGRPEHGAKERTEAVLANRWNCEYLKPGRAS